MSNNNQFNRNKMQAVILYACNTCDPQELGAVKLNKVLYFLDMIFYAHNGCVVTGAAYRKRPFGPASDNLLIELKNMKTQGDIDIQDVDYHGYIKKEYIAKNQSPKDVLNHQELSLLDDVIDFVCKKNSAKSISEYSHKLPWEMAEMGQIIPYKSAMLLFPTQPSPEAFEKVADRIHEIESERSKTNPLDLPLLSNFRGSLSQA